MKAVVYLLLAGSLLLSLPTLQAQVVIDFSKKQITGTPSQINVRTPITIRIINVNPVLYRYSVNLQGTPRLIDAFGSVAGILSLVHKESRGQPCANELSAAQQAADAIRDALPKRVANEKYESLTVAAFRTRWQAAKLPAYEKAIADLKRAMQTQDCAELQAKITPLLEACERDLPRLKSIESALESATTEMTTTGSLEPNNDYSITVTESWKELDQGTEVATEASPQIYTFSPTTNIFTLSAGYLVTQIDSRRYVRRTFPGATDTDPSTTVLAVEGANSLRPTGLALLNFQLPWTGSDTFGVAISAGPSVRLGSSNDTSSLGAFFGASVHLWRSLYLTPGWHIAEFADFPPGFYAGKTIPATFTGDPEPLKRWTVRFGLGISFRAKDFSRIETVKPASEKALPQAPPDGTGQPDKKTTQPTRVDPNNPPPVPQPND